MAFVATGLIPVLVLLGIFAVAPVVIVLWLSLHKYNQLAPVAPYIGLRNFEYAFTNDALFINGAIHEVMLTLGLVILKMYSIAVSGIILELLPPHAVKVSIHAPVKGRPCAFG